MDVESITYLDELVDEYLLFRGFVQTLKNFQQDRKGDKLKGFHVAKIVSQIFSYVHQYNILSLRELWDYLLEDDMASTVQKLELSLKRYYLVYAIQTGRIERALEFFKLYSHELATSRHWKAWFVLPYMKNPEQDVNFRVFFTKAWAESFSLSLHNFLSTIFKSVPLPRLLNFNVERNLRKTLEGHIAGLRHENDVLRGKFENTKRELERVRQANFVVVTPIQDGSAPIGGIDTSGQASTGGGGSTLSASGIFTPSLSASAPNVGTAGSTIMVGGGNYTGATASTGGQASTLAVPTAGGPALSASGGLPTSTASPHSPNSGANTSASNQASLRRQPSQTGYATTGNLGSMSMARTPQNDTKTTGRGEQKESALKGAARTIQSLFTGKSGRDTERRGGDGGKSQSPGSPQLASGPVAPGGAGSSGTPPLAQGLPAGGSPVTGGSTNSSASLAAGQASSSGANNLSGVDRVVPLKLAWNESYSASAPITVCKFSPGGSYVACGTQTGVVKVFPFMNAKNSATIYASSEILSLEWEPKTGKLLFCGTGDAKIKVWSPSADKIIGDLALPTNYSKVRKIACNPVDQTFATAASATGDAKGGAIFTWSMKNLTLINKIEIGTTVHSLNFNHNGTMLAAGCADGTIRMLDMSNFQPIMSWKAHSEPVLNVTFSYDETAIYSVGGDGKIARWSVHSPGKMLRQYQYEGLPDKTANAVDLAFDVDGKYFIVGSKHPYGYIYHTEVSAPLTRIGTHNPNSHVTCADWHPIDLCVLTGSTDTSLCMTGMGYDRSGGV